jgi:hypothetical protein
LKQEKEEALEKLRLHNKRKMTLGRSSKEDKEKIQKEKDQLLAEKTVVREAVTRALHSCAGLGTDGRRDN